MKKLLFVLILVFTTSLTQAQFIKEKSINAQIGFGLSAPINSTTDVVDDGFFAQGELVLKVASWAELRPYAGIVITNAGGEDLSGNLTNELAETKAFLLGGKARIRAPLPWVAPFVEVGIGTSIGSFRTFTFFDDIDKSGVLLHIPFSVGLELGRNHNFEFGLSYYYQPSVEQLAGAVAIGIGFRID
jgi:hypothetical protein